MSYTDPLIDSADAITAEIAAAFEAGLFEGLQAKPKRSYADWERPLDELDCLHVDVVPINYKSSTLKTRGTIGYLCESTILVRKRFAAEDRDQCGEIALAEVDRLVAFVRELHDLFIAKRLTTLPEAAWNDTQIAVAYDYDMLRSTGQFCGGVRVIYDVPKVLP